MSRCLNATILMAYALSGCATMSPEECLQANWEEVGYNDAVEGYPVSRSSEHREACASTGVQVDFELYRNGHALGLPYYCTRETGFETADHGGDFATQCRRETFPNYLVGYSEGLDVFALKTARSKFRSPKNPIRQRRFSCRSVNFGPRGTIPNSAQTPVGRPVTS
jgi:hypothetical protein